ncbi:MAG: acyloxyacyl hydrolase [Alphaproteobacteria bacterium]
MQVANMMGAERWPAVLGGLLVVAWLMAGPGMARADDLADDPAFFSVGLGYYDINDTQDAADLRFEFRAAPKLLGFLKPWAGLEVTSDSAVYGVAGVLTDIYFGNRWVVTPQFGAGLYADGSGKDLGHVVEFRSQLELAYRLADRSRIGLAISHISNAGLDDSNQGTEILSLYYHIPFTSLIDQY